MTHEDLVREARIWLSDCIWEDLEPEDIEALTGEQVLRGICRHYEGGLVQFVEDGNAAIGGETR